MVFSYSFKWLPILLAAASLITIASADQALINSICSTIRHPALCFKVLKNSVNADRGGLGQISTNVALRKVHKSLNLIKKLAKKASDLKTKNQYDTCLEVYDDLLYRLKECKTRFGENDFNDANALASAAFDDVDTCSEEATNAPPQLQAALQEYADYLYIPLVVSNIGPP